MVFSIFEREGSTVLTRNDQRIIGAVMTMKRDSLYVVLFLAACTLCTSCATSRNSQFTTNDDLYVYKETIRNRVERSIHQTMTIDALRAKVEKMGRGASLSQITGERALNDLLYLIEKNEAQLDEEIRTLQEILTRTPPGVGTFRQSDDTGAE